MKEFDIIIENPEQGIINYEPLKAWALEQAAVYGNLLVNPDDIPAAKSECAVLRRMAKTASDLRIRINTEHEAKIATVTNQLKEVTKIFNDAAANIDAQVKEYDAQRRLVREAEINQIFAGEIGDLADYMISLDKISDPSWLNKTTSLKTVQADIQTALHNIREALSQIKEYHSPHENAMISAYLERLSMTDALNTKKRMEELAATMEKRKEEKPAEAPKQTVIAFAEKRLAEEAKAGNNELVKYWAAYLDGARAQKREDGR